MEECLVTWKMPKPERIFVPESSTTIKVSSDLVQLFSYETNRFQFHFALCPPSHKS